MSNYVVQAKDKTFFDKDDIPLAGEALYQEVIKKSGTNKILLAFSCGKDSIALWLELKKYFEIYPYFMYWIPGLRFIEDALKYYEDFFGVHILRLPHPIFYKYLNDFAYQPPERVAIIRALNFPNYDLADIDKIAASYYQLKTPFCAMGIRAADNMDRRRLIYQQGVAGTGKRKFFYGIWNWNIQQVSAIIIQNKVKLPIDYDVFGRTLAAWDYQYLKPLKENFPDDYKIMLEWFPLLDLELFRYEQITSQKS